MDSNQLVPYINNSCGHRFLMFWNCLSGMPLLDGSRSRELSKFNYAVLSVRRALGTVVITEGEGYRKRFAEMVQHD